MVGLHLNISKQLIINKSQEYGFYFRVNALVDPLEGQNNIAKHYKGNNQIALYRLLELLPMKNRYLANTTPLLDFIICRQKQV